MAKMTKEERAHRYLQASMAADFNRENPSAREAYEAQMASHERAYPRVREHALAGADRDFDERLAPGEREHQRHLRRQDGMHEADVHRIRKELRDGQDGQRRARKPRTRTGAGTGPRTARKAAAAGAGAVTSAATGGGNIFLYLLGVTLLLSLVYLLVAGKGVNAVTGITNAVVGGVGAFIKPVDPVAAAQRALGATPTQASSSTESSAGAGGGSIPPSALVPGNSAGTGAPDAASPKSGTLTWTWLRRETKAGHLTRPQVTRDLKLLQEGI